MMNKPFSGRSGSYRHEKGSHDQVLGHSGTQGIPGDLIIEEVLLMGSTVEPAFTGGNTGNVGLVEIIPRHMEKPGPIEVKAP